MNTPARAAFLALACLVTTSMLGIAGTTSAAPLTGEQGVEDGWAVGDAGQVTGAQLLSDQLGMFQQAGAGWVRINFRLGGCFRDWTSPGCNGGTALEAYDRVVNSAQTDGLHVLGLVSAESWPGSQGDWTAGNAEFAGGTGLNPYVTDFSQNAAAVLAAHFRTRVNAWELWSEPNAWAANPDPGMYVGGSFLYPSNFAQLLTASASLMHARAPGARIISGGVLSTDVGGGAKGARSGYRSRAPALDEACPSLLPSGGDYLCSAYDMGRLYAGWAGGAPFDEIGQHLYIDQTSITSASKLAEYVADVRAVYVDYGGKPAATQTQITEFGWSTAAVSETTQAYNLTVAYGLFHRARSPYVARAYWFRLQDLSVAGDGYGLVDSAGVPKPAYQAYQRAAGGRVPVG